MMNADEKRDAIRKALYRAIEPHRGELATSELAEFCDSMASLFDASDDEEKGDAPAPVVDIPPGTFTDR